MAEQRAGTRFVFVDTEATGLDHARHELTEVAWIVRFEDGREVERVYVPEHTLDAAEPDALRLTHYHDRLADQPRTPMSEWLGQFLEDADGAVLVGAVPDFDARHLHQACRKLGVEPTWDHHLLDVETLALPLLAEAPEAPRSLAKTCGGLGVAHDRGQAHGALYDAKQAMAVFDRVWELVAAVRAGDQPLPPPVPRPTSGAAGAADAPTDDTVATAQAADPPTDADATDATDATDAPTGTIDTAGAPSDSPNADSPNADVPTGDADAEEPTEVADTWAAEDAGTLDRDADAADPDAGGPDAGPEATDAAEVAESHGAVEAPPDEAPDAATHDDIGSPTTSLAPSTGPPGAAPAATPTPAAPPAAAATASPATELAELPPPDQGDRTADDRVVPITAPSAPTGSAASDLEGLPPPAADDLVSSGPPPLPTRG